MSILKILHLISSFDSLSFTADAAFSVFSTTLKTNSCASQKNSRARFDYLAIGIPM
jgi:hypothetical protein